MTKRMLSVFYKMYKYSLLFCLLSVVVTQSRNAPKWMPWYENLSYATWEAFVARPFFLREKQVKTEIGILSSPEVAKLLETNPESFPCFQEEGISNSNHEQEYLVVRCRRQGFSRYGFIKCYYSCFPYPFGYNIEMTKEFEPYNIIIPYPDFLHENSNHPCKTTLRWKNLQ